MPPDIPPEEVEFVRIDRALITCAFDALAAAENNGLRVITVESCTGGLLATVLTDIPGASQYYEGGFVTYTPEHKAEALSLDLDFIRRHGTVSPEVTIALAEAALRHSRADIALSVTGVAGPDKDEKGNPVGLVHLACARHGCPTEHIEHRFGDIGRAQIRYGAAEKALNLLRQIATEAPSRKNA